MNDITLNAFFDELTKLAASLERSGERWSTVPGATGLSEDTHNPGHYMLTRNYGSTGEMENFYLKLTPEQRDTGNFDRKDILGYVGSHPMGQDRWEINSLYVDPQHRRKGIADALVGYHVNKVHPNKQMVVLTDPDKEGNVAKNYLTKLYAKHGFSGELRDIMPGAMHRPASGNLTKTAAETATKTDPEKWERAKRDAVERMGGKHSARAMQLAVNLYKDRGGGYVGKKPSAENNSMRKWTKQEWQTRPGTPERAERSDGSTARYLPKEKWESLSKKEQIATDRKKLRAKEQYVDNTRAAKVRADADYID